MWIGSNIDNVRTPFNITWTNEPVKFLGIFVGYDQETCDKKNWDEKIVDLENILKLWEKRNLSFFGKITIIKTLAISKLVYNASIINVPTHIFPKVEKILYRFLWGSNKEKIKRKTLIKNVEEGGLNMIHFASVVMSLKLSWVKRLFKSGSR